MRFRSLAGAASLYCILRLIFLSYNSLLLKDEMGFCSGTVVPPVSVEFGTEPME
jgi:hypothetical protein